MLYYPYERSEFMLKKVIYWLLVILWLIVIYTVSAHNGTVSTNESKSFTAKTIDTVAKTAQKMGIIEEIPTGKEAEQLVKKINPIVRKIAHFSVYFILGFLLMMALTPYKMPLWLQLMLTIVLCFLYAITDELHQTFVSGRNGTFIDCIIDTVGSLCAALVYAVHIKNKKKS